MLGFIALIGFTLAGEAVAAALALPVPGSIVGLLMLLAHLGLGGVGSGEIDASARQILRLLPLFLVPIGVAVVGLADLPGAQVPLLVATLMVALVSGVVVVSTVMRLAIARTS